MAPIGDAPWLGTFPEVFRDTVRPAIAAAGSDTDEARVILGPVSSDTINMSCFSWTSCASQAEVRP
jgi:hypothetical protein